jgi:hypothetical protein
VKVLIAFMLTLVSCIVYAQVDTTTPGWMTFPVSPITPLTDGLLDSILLSGRPADQRIVVQDGHFHVQGGERIRFWGTNLTFSSCFPAKDSATLLAQNLARMGFNIIRFHHMDNRDIWQDNANSILDPEKLDRLDWLIYQLKKRGVYSNINLHVSRNYPGFDFSNAPRLIRYGKIVDHFYGPFIDLQKQYARDLLDRVNPYTGLKLTQDPAIAMVEINNENSLLKLLDGPTYEELPELFRSALQPQWEAWLTARYGTLSAMSAAWNNGVTPTGSEMLANPDFADSLNSWNFQAVSGAPPVFARDTLLPDTPYIRVTLTDTADVSWGYQIYQLNMPIKDSAAYTVTFRAKANPARYFYIALMHSAPGHYEHVSNDAKIWVDSTWQTDTFYLTTGSVIDTVPVRFNMGFGDQPGEFCLDAISLKEGMTPFADTGTITGVGLPGSLPLPNTMRDFRLFLIDRENDYSQTMKRFLKDTLEVSALLSGTQCEYGGYYGLHRESRLFDYIDIHAYWQHPHFPGTAWDKTNWDIPNTPMSADTTGGPIYRWSSSHLEGMPFSISEADHPFPNDFAAEGLIMDAACALHKDWDAVYQFCYMSQLTGFDQNKVINYFDLGSHSTKVVSSVLGALLFRQAMVESAPQTINVDLPLPAMAMTLPLEYVNSDGWLNEKLIQKNAIIGTRFGLRFSDTGSTAPVLPDYPLSDSLIRTNDLTWSPAGSDSFFLVHTDRAVCATGSIGGKTLALNGVRLTALPPDDGFAVAGLVSLDSLPLTTSRRMLFCSMSRSENSNMGWNAERTTLGADWGTAPVVSQIVPAALSVPGDSFRAYSLNSLGQIIDTLPVYPRADACSLFVGDSAPSLWYYLERTGTAGIGSQRAANGAPSLSVFPNPFNPTVVVLFCQPVGTGVETQNIASLRAKPTVKIFTATGRLTADLSSEIKPVDKHGQYRVTWHAQGLATGVYLLKIDGAGLRWRKKLMLIK